MRSAVVICVFGLAACSASHGTYLVVDGEPAGITFDQVEFFLGKDRGAATPFTPGSPFIAVANPGATDRQRLTERVFTESDLQPTAETTSLTYYLSPEVANTYAHYALVVASRQGVPVGLGEVEAYNVPDDRAFIYTIPLVPVDAGFERWGAPQTTAADCVRWTRMRDGDATKSTYAVVRGDDYDCDGSRSSADCDDLNFCADPANGAGCSRRVTGCITETCDLGVCTDGTPQTSGRKACAPKVCLPDAFCVAGDPCRESDSAAEFLACAVGLLTSHTEVTMPVERLDGPLCTHNFDVTPPDNLRCVAPMIEWPPLGNAGAWKVSVTRSTVNLDKCTFNLTGPTPDAPPPADTHVVVSVDAMLTPARRTSFVVGFAPFTTLPLGCLIQQVDIQDPSGSTAPTCP